MSFTGLDYDVGAYRQTLRESTGVGSYFIDTPLPHNSGRIDAKHTDVESELQGLPRRLSECPSKNYLPGKYDTSSVPRIPGNIHLRRDHLYPEDTRVSNPPSTMRGAGVNRFGHPLEPPQEHALEPFAWPTSDTRNAKDNHRPYVAEMVDVRDALPPAAPENVPQPEWVFDPVPTIPHVVVSQPPKEFRYIL
nr:hypothetical protein TetV2_00252 [Oceanusvirus sp.]